MSHPPRTVEHPSIVHGKGSVAMNGLETLGRILYLATFAKECHSLITETPDIPSLLLSQKAVLDMLVDEINGYIDTQEEAE